MGTEDSVFLYNPWEKEDTINYYWTNKSFQKILITFYNPLLVDIRVNKIVIIFEGAKPFCLPSI
jgi:hypothetical protein